MFSFLLFLLHPFGLGAWVKPCSIFLSRCNKGQIRTLIVILEERRTIKMAKAASYMRNVGKSLGYSLINEIKNSNPAIASFSNNNSEAIRATYNAIAHMNKTVQSVASKILDSKYGELGKYALQNIKEDRS